MIYHFVLAGNSKTLRLADSSKDYEHQPAEEKTTEERPACEEKEKKLSKNQSLEASMANASFHEPGVSDNEDEDDGIPSQASQEIVRR